MLTSGRWPRRHHRARNTPQRLPDRWQHSTIASRLAEPRPRRHIPASTTPSSCQTSGNTPSFCKAQPRPRPPEHARTIPSPARHAPAPPRPAATRTVRIETEPRPRSQGRRNVPPASRTPVRPVRGHAAAPQPSSDRSAATRGSPPSPASPRGLERPLPAPPPTSTAGPLAVRAVGARPISPPSHSTNSVPSVCAEHPKLANNPRRCASGEVGGRRRSR